MPRTQEIRLLRGAFVYKANGNATTSYTRAVVRASHSAGVWVKLLKMDAPVPGKMREV